MKNLNRILRSPDVVDGADPLDTPCNDIDTSFPLAPASTYPFECTKAEKTTKKDDESRELIAYTLTNTSTITSTKGEPMPPGSLPLIGRVSITPSDKMDNRAIAKNIARVVKGLGLNLTPRQVMNDPSLLVGGKGDWKVKLRPETNEFPARNELGDPVIRG
jgi:hypothetical protein